MKKLLLGLILGYGLRIVGFELGNISMQLRWQKCIAQMNSGEVPAQLPGGQHYCLGTVFTSENVTLFEKISLYQPDYWQTMGDQ